jgi:hypothetical protein
MVSQPRDLVTANLGPGTAARVAVIVGRFSNRRSWAYSARIRVGVSTSNRAGPAGTITERAAAGDEPTNAARAATVTARAAR